MGAAPNAFLLALGDQCTGWPDPITTYATRAAAVAKLTTAAYYYTSTPSGVCATQGSAAYGQDGNDYTRPLYLCSVAGNPTKCYRMHGKVSASAPWTFRVQGAQPGGTTGQREPNPELCEYTWPNWWWGAYTYYFHRYYC